ERAAVDDRRIRGRHREIVVVEPSVLGADGGPGRSGHRGGEEKTGQDRESDTRQGGDHVFTLHRANVCGCGSVVSGRSMPPGGGAQSTKTGQSSAGPVTKTG